MKIEVNQKGGYYNKEDRLRKRILPGKHRGPLQRENRYRLERGYYKGKIGVV